VNRFGGILADDMGLGKTVQTLSWLLWLRANPEMKGIAAGKGTKPEPALVIAPKSVVDIWVSETAKFAPELRVCVIGKGGCDARTLDAAREKAEIVVMNYTGLRNLEKELAAVAWSAIILDEAQAIKNPRAPPPRLHGHSGAHRVALSGTPIENRLLDLWSIMAFTMPGVLGPRAAFGKHLISVVTHSHAVASPRACARSSFAARKARSRKTFPTAWRKTSCARWKARKPPSTAPN